ncbi:MAG TPA: hypothetical protein VFW98_17665 [Gemmatimonadaceae bacterium]|nr:hypothetical protein [Gemmatimonadaceae bacterium]
MGYIKRRVWETQKRHGRSYLIWHEYVLKRYAPIAILLAFLEYLRDATGQPKRDTLVFVFCLGVVLVFAIPIDYLAGRRYWNTSRARYDRPREEQGEDPSQ